MSQSNNSTTSPDKDQNILNLLMKLISFDTSIRENEAMQYIQSYIQELYGEQLYFELQDIGDQGRYNLIIKNTDQPDILLAGHVDVVPEISKEQYIPRREDDKIYGRGAVDMKAGVAINLSLIEELLLAKRKFWVLCYADEETDFLGMQAFVKAYAGKIQPEITIIPEPSNAVIYTGFRGLASIEMEIEGKAAHSARKNEGINAITEFTYFTDALEKFLQSRDLGGYVSYVNLAGIEGGIKKDNQVIRKENITPPYAKGLFSLRLGNQFSPEELTSFMDSYFALRGAHVISQKIILWYNPVIQQGLEQKYAQYGQVAPGHTFGYSDIQFVKEYIGGDCLLIGPGPNTKSHQADEYVEIESIFVSRDIIRKILHLAE